MSTVVAEKWNNGHEIGKDMEGPQGGTENHMWKPAMIRESEKRNTEFVKLNKLMAYDL